MRMPSVLALVEGIGVTLHGGILMGGRVVQASVLPPLENRSQRTV
jgi:hypothetical protein